MASNRQRLQKIFGFYPEPFQLNAGSVTITPLPEFEQSIADTLASDHIERTGYTHHLNRPVSSEVEKSVTVPTPPACSGYRKLT